MTTDGPSPARILAAAGSVSAGIGLVAILAGTADSSEVVVRVEPTPVVVAPAPADPNPASIAPAATEPATPDPALARPIEAAIPPPTTAPAASVVTTTEAS